MGKNSDLRVFFEGVNGAETSNTFPSGNASFFKLI
jgi:hypothetical protein